MTGNRILFVGNPWPEGHPIKAFIWTAREENDDIWFDFHLETEDYYSERDVEDNEDNEYESDWEAPVVWGNYHSCTMSTNEWHMGGFRVCKKSEFSPEYLDGVELEVDNVEDASGPYEDRAFHIYLLGHDAVAKHKILFQRISGTNSFNISWEGKIAQAYIGIYTLDHEFKATLNEVPFPTPVLNEEPSSQTKPWWKFW